MRASAGLLTHKCAQDLAKRIAHLLVGIDAGCASQGYDRNSIVYSRRKNIGVHLIIDGRAVAGQAVAKRRLTDWPARRWQLPRSAWPFPSDETCRPRGWNSLRPSWHGRASPSCAPVPD